MSFRTRPGAPTAGAAACSPESRKRGPHSGDHSHIRVDPATACDHPAGRDDGRPMPAPATVQRDAGDTAGPALQMPRTSAPVAACRRGSGGQPSLTPWANVRQGNGSASTTCSVERIHRSNLIGMGRSDGHVLARYARWQSVHQGGSDIDLSRGTALVRRGKGGKGRFVPFGPHTGRALDRYIRLRRARPG